MFPIKTLELDSQAAMKTASFRGFSGFWMTCTGSLHAEVLFQTKKKLGSSKIKQIFQKTHRAAEDPPISKLQSDSLWESHPNLLRVHLIQKQTHGTHRNQPQDSPSPTQHNNRPSFNRPWDRDRDHPYLSHPKNPKTRANLVNQHRLDL